MHIGYVYGDWQNPEDASKYTPKFIPGIRLPHTWVEPVTIPASGLPPAIDVSYVKEFSQGDVQSRRYSMLDLCAKDRFTFFVYSPKSCDFVGDVFEFLASRLKDATVPFMTVIVSEQLRDLEQSRQGSNWLALSGLKEGRILVVRPDQHILACVEEGSTSDHVAEKILKYLRISHQSITALVNPGSEFFLILRGASALHLTFSRGRGVSYCHSTHTNHV